jgi:hypothetical protein
MRKELAMSVSSLNGAKAPISAQRRRRFPPNTSALLIKKCGNGKWLDALNGQIARRVGQIESDIPHLVHMVQSSHKHRASVETKRVGGKTLYRIFKQDKTVSVEELTTKLRPIVEDLKAEGRKNMATMVPAEVAMLAARLERLLNEWAE